MKRKKIVLRDYQVAAIRAIGRHILRCFDGTVVDEPHALGVGPVPVGGGMVIGTTATPRRADGALLTVLSLGGRDQ